MSVSLSSDAIKKVVIVNRDEEIFSYFTEVYEGKWDTQVLAKNPSEMWDLIDAGKISQESGIFIFDDRDFDPKDIADNLFIESVGVIAPKAMVLILEYDPHKTPIIKSRVREYQQITKTLPATFYPLAPGNDIPNDIKDYIVEYEQSLYAPDSFSDDEIAEMQQQKDTVSSQQPSLSPKSMDGNSIVEFANSQSTNHKGFVIASTSSKGGTGKTTTAVTLATMFYHSSRLAYEEGKRERPLDVCIVDMDIRDGQIGFLLGKVHPTALNLVIDQDLSPQNIRKNLVYDEDLGIHALLAPKRARTSDYVTPEFFTEVVQQLRTMFDIIILDTSVQYLEPLLGKVALPMADAVIFVTDLSPGGIMGMRRWVDEVTTSSDQGGMSAISVKKIGVVVNQSMANVGMTKEKIEKAANGATVLVNIPSHPADVTAASNMHGIAKLVLRHESISPPFFVLAKRIRKNEELVSPINYLHEHGEVGYGGDPDSLPSTPTPQNLTPNSLPKPLKGNEKKKKRRKFF